MKNNKGFTLVEIISVIAILALLIIVAVPVVSNSSKETEKKVLQTKIDNIKKSAIIYAQDKNFKFETTGCNACDATTPAGGMDYDNDDYIDNCFCSSTGTITIENLLTEGYIAPDEESGNDIYNPVDKTKSLKTCSITLYKKYGKIYAIYNAEDTNHETCWYK